MHVRSLFAPLAVLALTWSAGSAEAQTILRFKFAKGQTNNYEMLQDMKVTQAVGGNTIDMRTKQTIELSQFVDDVLGDGGAKINTKFTRVKMEIKGPLTVALDSAEPKGADDNPLAQAMADVVKTLAKVDFVATQRLNGEFVDFKIPEALVQEFRALSGNATAGVLFSEQGLKQMVGQGSIVLPKDAIAVGDSWTQKVSNQLPAGKMTGEMKYTYQGNETVDGKALQKITCTFTFAIDPDANAATTIKTKEQKATGVIFFDNELGRLHGLVMDSAMEMTVAVANFNTDQAVTQRVTMKLRK